MKRALAAIAATVGGVLWLVTFRVTAHPPTLAAEPAEGSPSPAVSPTPEASPSAATTPTPSPSPSPSPAQQVLTGSDVQTIFGDVQVQITVSGQRLVDVRALRLPVDRARSAEISQYAGPYLRSEAIRAQNARIDIVSGATYTSEAYAESLADALGQAHLG